MADVDKNTLGAPPKTLTRAEVLAKIGAKIETREVAGWGVVEFHPVTLAAQHRIEEEATGADGKVDQATAELRTLIASCPALFTEDDLAALQETPIGTLLPLVTALVSVFGVDMSGNGRAANVPLTFREVPKPRRRVQRGK